MITATKATDKAATPEPSITFPYQENKKVYIRRKPNNGGLPGQNLDDSLQKIGSAYRNQDVLRGLTHAEEAKYLPSIIGVQPSDVKWLEKTRDYWANISKPVPAGDGLELEVGFIWYSKEDYDKDRTAEFNKESGVSIYKYGVPLNLPDYILYRYCLLYNRVANSADDMYKSPKIAFYMYSKDEEIKAKKQSLTTKKSANQLLYANIDDREWASHVASMLVAMDRTADLTVAKVQTMSVDEIDILLHKYVESNPGNFLAIAKDKNLKDKAFLERCIANSLLHRIPNTQIITHNDIPIGDTLEEAIAYVQNDKNAKVVAGLKAQLQEIRK